MRFLYAALVALMIVAVNGRLMTVDLGSEFMKVGILSRGKPIQIVENVASKRKSETVVAFDQRGNRQFANGALKLSTRMPTRTFRLLPTILGQPYDSHAVRVYQERFPFHNLSSDERGIVQITDDEGIVRSVEEYVAMLLQNCVDITTNFGGEPVETAIIAVPRFYSQVERKAVLAAAKLIDLKVSQLINSDLAAAVNYGSFRAETFKKKPQKILLYDMGSASTTATVFQYKWTKNKEIGRQQPALEVIASAHDRNLGGFDFDLVVREILIERFHEMKGVKANIRTNQRAMARLLIEAEKVKKVLSANQQTTCYIENLAEDKDFKTVVKRAELEKRAATLLQRAQGPLATVLRELDSLHDVSLSDIDSVIIIGGGGRIPKIQALLKEVIGGRELDKNLNGDDSVAMGAAYRAADLSPSHRVPQKWTVKDAVLVPIHVTFMRPEYTAHDGTVEPEKEVTKVLFKYMNTMPQKKTMTFTKHTSDFELQVYHDNVDVLAGQEKYFGERNLTTVLVGLSDALKNEDAKTFDAVKVHFVVDASSVFAVEGIDIVFNRSKAVVVEDGEGEGVLGGMFNTLFGSDSKPAPVDGQEQDKEAPTKEGEDGDGGDDEEKANDTPANKTDGETGNNETTANDEAHVNASGANATNATKDAGKAKKAKKDQSKKKKKTKNAELVVNAVGFREDVATGQRSLPAHAFNASHASLAALAKADRERIERALAMTELEGYALDCRMNLNEEEYEEVSNQTERVTITELSNEVSDWLYEDGFDATTAEYRTKLGELKELMAPIVFRKTERMHRPQAIARLHELVNMTTKFLNSSRNDTWRVVAHLDALELLMNTTVDWLAEQEILQEQVAVNEDPVLNSTMISSKVDKLSSKMLKEMSRPPPPPPKKTKKKKSKSDNETKTTGDEEGNAETNTTDTASETNTTDTASETNTTDADEGSDHGQQENGTASDDSEGEAEGEDATGADEAPADEAGDDHTEL